jgi:EmrB/QacA subfamily drug resistance transporter
MEQSAQQQTTVQDSVYRNRYIILAIILIGTFMAMLDATMVSIALPNMTVHFNVDLIQSQWTITGYLLAMTGLFIFFGKVSDYTGKARLFMAGWAIFGLSSLACGLAPGLKELIAFRIAQGIGASMVACISAAMIYLVFPPQERGKALGMVGVVFGGAALIGPGLGGFIVDSLGWQYIFFINVPLCIVLLALALKYLKIPEQTTKRFEMDWIGAATLFVAIVTLMLLCTEIAKDQKVTDVKLAYAAVSGIATVAFLFYESRCARPLLDLSIFHNRRFTLPIVSAMLLYAGISLATTLAPFYFQGAMGYTASEVGYISMVVPLFMMFAAPISGGMYDKRHWKFQSAAGLVVYAAGMIAMGLGVVAMNFWLIIVAFAVRGIGAGIFSSPNGIETMSAVAREKLGVASSVQYTANYMAIMVGVAFSTILVTASLNGNGYSGPVILAGPSLLSTSVGAIMFVAAALCVIAAVVSVLRNIGTRGVSKQAVSKTQKEA